MGWTLETSLSGERGSQQRRQTATGRKHICMSGAALDKDLFLIPLQSLKVFSIDHVNFTKDIWTRKGG